MSKALGDQAEYQGPYGLIRERLQNIPSFWFDTGADTVVDIRRNAEVAAQLPQAVYTLFPKKLGIEHNLSFQEPPNDATEAAQALREATTTWTDFLLSFQKPAE